MRQRKVSTILFPAVINHDSVGKGGKARGRGKRGEAMAKSWPFSFL